MSSLTGPDRESAVAQLHALLLRGARREAARRTGQNGVGGVELDDLAHQAADDAVISVLRRLPEFRGESRFTTWAYKFVVLEVASKITRHTWRRPVVPIDDDAWDRLPHRLGIGPSDPVETIQIAEMVDTVRRVVEQELTDHQRHVFVTIVLQGVPLDALVEELSTNRNAIYKCLFDARRKIRVHLVADGYLEPTTGASS